ncbi:MAG: hypothetical protein Q8K86_11590 [Candidatus Nanopelagicaceae bacterium]|nr:hypothetical protein [Candidatus Nanopelagicaceae bacterium]
MTRKELERRLDETFAKRAPAVKTKLLKEDRSPSEGIWYLLWLKPYWVLRDFKESEFPGLNHSDIWEQSLYLDVAKHYGLTSKPFKLLSYAFPRGRIVNLNPSKKEIGTRAETARGRWVVLFGNDLPNASLWKKRVITAFNLAPFLPIEWRFDEHETTQEEDVTEMKSLIGEYE